MKFEEPQNITGSEDEPTRQEQARRVAKEIGHIDFSNPDTANLLVCLDLGLDEHGDPYTPGKYIEDFKRAYGHESNDEELKSNLLLNIEAKFGTQGRHPNPKLIEGIKKILGEAEAIQKPRTTGDILEGTSYAGIPDEKLNYGQSLYGEHGEIVNPGDPGYREAFARMIQK